jgi:hypothetical protein
VKVGEKTPTQLGPLERANFNHWTLFFFILFPPEFHAQGLRELGNNGLHSTCHVQVGMWMSYGKIQTFREYRFLCFCENVFGKVENKFVGGRCWGRPLLLIIESGKFTTVSLLLLVTYFPK